MRSATATPSSSALCANIGPRTTSPTAHTFGRLVRQSASTAMKPRSSNFKPTASACNPMVLGTRPIEIMSLSNTVLCDSPFASVYSTLTSCLPALIAPIFTPR